MVFTRNMFAALILSTLLAIMLSIFFQGSMQKNEMLQPVFKISQPIVLDQTNLVDIMTQVNSQMAITRVQWQNHNLSVDYKVTADKPVYVNDIYDELYQSVYTAYLLTSNVQGLYVRVLYEEKGNEEVLIALSAERSNQLLEELSSVSAEKDKKALLHKLTNISFGVLWQEKIQK
ncbi:hypothetical protein [Ammoniphilus resinae]|uniref:Uncharacterized protein n=1 Tax=Ammoniphilus resinae TaxID=861532 RepID=A0ABS4GTT4_9BACL|nr:hypothetical protein [Ammoniphilus resinae]MBP1933457.1 hypothetical protein [Ammoniphilus resinae]